MLTLNRWPSAWHRFWRGDPVEFSWFSSGLVPPQRPQLLPPAEWCPALPYELPKGAQNHETYQRGHQIDKIINVLFYQSALRALLNARRINVTKKMKQFLTWKSLLTLIWSFRVSASFLSCSISPMVIDIRRCHQRRPVKMSAKLRILKLRKVIGEKKNQQTSFTK